MAAAGLASALRRAGWDGRLWFRVRGTGIKVRGDVDNCEVRGRRVLWSSARRNPRPAAPSPRKTRFIARRAALVPLPRAHQTGYHTAFSLPASALRAAVDTVAGRGQGVRARALEVERTPNAAGMTWMQCLKRVFDIDSEDPPPVWWQAPGHCEPRGRRVHRAVVVHRGSALKTTFCETLCATRGAAAVFALKPHAFRPTPRRRPPLRGTSRIRSAPRATTDGAFSDQAG